ncbi:serine/threonine-protein kinase [Nocardia alni]|uniref:serine/threonine-protein kinase n=1 Tax=Nocardia alni TaxID=2815723 RepID=UPI001C24D32C|nr:serine/threonine-protein kinase [Nocardia alni]
MGRSDDGATQRDLPTGITAELAAAGFGEAEEIGRGGFGIVYRCYEYTLERHVAVKILMSEVRGDEREQFVREQRALGRLSGHPHILQVLQADITATGRPYIVMPYHAQGSLDRMLDRLGALRWPDVLSIGVKIAGALAAAHALGILHRDVKPGNILLTDYGEPQLSDFGIAHFGEQISVEPIVAGTPAFTAPEVLGGAVPTAASDIYGLGATLFSLLAGHAAYARRTGETLEAQLARIATAPLPDLREFDIPDAVCAAIEAAMATDPARRPASATDFGETLRDVQRGCGCPVDAMAVPPAAPTAITGAPPAPLVAHPAGSVTPPSAATRFRPPDPPRTQIERTRLLDALGQAPTRRLTVIHGPAGFGKTVLAAQWGRRLESQGMPIAWLSADSDDDNLVWFLAHLVEAIRRVRPDLAREMGALLEEHASDTARYVLSTLIDEIHDSGRALVLVIDDWHRVTGRTTLAALDYLLERGCHHLRIVVVTRARDRLPLSRLLVQDELLEFDTAALRFDSAETREFLVAENNLPLTDAEVTALQEATEGWPAALQLAALSLRGREDPDSFIEQLTGRHHIIGEYLAENVLKSLDPRLLDFLLCTSITARIRADLATVLSGRADSQELLEQITDRGLFLRRLDEDSEWFRYGRLFADYLHRRLVQEQPDRLDRLHELAGSWFAEHGMLTEALDHALASGDPARAADLLEARAEPLIAESRMTTFLGLMAKLPVGLAELRPRLQLSAAWAYLALQRPQPMHAALHHTLAALATTSPPEPLATALRVEAAMVSCVELYVTDRLNGLPDLVLEHRQDPLGDFTAICAANLSAIDALDHFEFDEATRWFVWAAPHALGQGAPFLIMHGRCIAGLAALEQLDIPTAEQLFEAAIAIAQRSGSGPNQFTTLAGVLLGELRYQQGRIAEATELLTASARLGRHGGPVDFLLATFGTGARLSALRGDLDTAAQHLATGETIANAGSLSRLTARILDERSRLGLPIAPDVRARLLSLPPYGKQDNRIHAAIAELEQEAAIRLLLARHTAAAADEACTRADRMMRQIRSQHRPLALLRAQLLHSCCLWAAGRRDEAKHTLQPALSRCADHGLPQLAADAGPQITEIIAAIG